MTGSVPGVDGETSGGSTVHQLAEELLARWWVVPQKSLMGEALLDLAGHPVVGINHTLSHGLVDLQWLARDQSRDVPSLIQLSADLRRMVRWQTG